MFNFLFFILNIIS